MIARRRLLAAGAAVAAGAFAAAGTTATAADPDRRKIDQRSQLRRLMELAPRRSWTVDTIGLSAEGRPIECWTSEAPAARGTAAGASRPDVVTALVVAGIHGNEHATEAIARGITTSAVPDDVSVSVIPTANPDGLAASTRRNAQGVDLNRNFPWRWARSDGGPSEASAPEVQAITSFVLGRSFDVAAWIHQPLGYVAPIGECPVEYADAWRWETGSRRRDGIDQHGGGETWCAMVAGVPTILVEVDSWQPDQLLVDRHVRGFVTCVEAVRRR